MSKLFEAQKVKLISNGIQYKPGTRQPVGNYQEVATDVPCRIVSTGSGSNKSLILCILGKHAKKLSQFPRRGWKVVVLDETFSANIEYQIKTEPVWVGGCKHHLECDLEEKV